MRAGQTSIGPSICCKTASTRFQTRENYATHSNKYTTYAKCVAYVHTYFGFPLISTFIKAVGNGGLHNFKPALTRRMNTTNQLVTKDTTFGFLDQT